ncbi:MAG: DUF87 domain-containing protein [Planctomycetales bacterium]|nr:DUF87 domain-containing protein [Planctomycetales bacterium]
MLYLLKLPSGPCPNASEAMNAVLQGIHAANFRSLSIKLMLASDGGRVRYLVECPAELRAVLLVYLLDLMPGVTLEPVSDRPGPLQRPSKIATFVPQHDFLFLRRNTTLHDPLTGLLSVLSSSKARRLGLALQIELTPAKPAQLRRATRAGVVAQRPCINRRLHQSILRLLSSSRHLERCCGRMAAKLFTQRTEDARTSEKLTQPLFAACIQMTSSANGAGADEVRNLIGDLAGGMSLFATTDNRFIRGTKRRFGLLSPAEVAVLWHPVDDSVHVTRLERSPLCEVEPPQHLPSSQSQRTFTPVGRVAFRKDRRLAGLTLPSLRRHVYITGKTGVGKTSLMQTMLRANLQAGLGVGLIDPHGDLYRETLAQVPRRRTNQVILFDPSSTSQLVPFNPLDTSIGIDRGRLADGVLSAFVKVFGLEVSTAPRLLHIFRNALLTMVEQPDATLVGINRLLTDNDYRKVAVGRVSNPAVREFWRGEFGRWHDRDRTMFLASLQNKLGAFLSNRQLQLILGQPRSGFSMRRVMDEKMILLCNLSKGQLGEDAANLLGALLLSCMQLAGESRTDVPEDERNDFLCYVDEVQNYATTALVTALSESRKYRAPLLVLANQFRDQLSPELRSAIIGNCGSIITFQVGAEDAGFWKQYYGDKMSEQHLMMIPKYHAIANLLVEGMPSGPMTIQTLPPRPGHSADAKRVSRQAARQFARPVTELQSSVEKLFH